MHMLIEGIVGLTLIALASAFVTKFVLEMMNLPVLSEEEWELMHGTRPLTDEEMADSDVA